MITKELIDGLKVSQAVTLAAGAAGTTDIEGITLDMANFEGVVVSVTMGAIVTNAVTSIKMQQGDASDLSDAQDLLGTGQTIADDDDGKTFLIGLHKPSKRYVRLYVDRATQNATVAAASYHQYGARTIPVPAHGANVSAESFVAPAEGTA